jgi:hypothetical protein
MDQGFRRGFTAAEKTELWDRWQRGESLKAIGRAFGNTMPPRDADVTYSVSDLRRINLIVVRADEDGS